MQNWELEFYESASGRQPVTEFLESLSDREAARVTKLLDLLEAQGAQLTMPYARRMEGTRLWELRIIGGVQHRVFYVALHGRRFILLHAFSKKTQRTPKRELRTAEQRLSDYEERMR